MKLLCSFRLLGLLGLLSLGGANHARGQCFQPAQPYAVGEFPTRVAVGDFNGDGNPDLVAANQNNTVSVLLGAGDGTFGPKTDYPAGDSPADVAVGDFNGDGNPDLVTANSGGTVSVLLGASDGTFGPKNDYGAGNEPVSVAVGDFNRDGRPDLAVTNQSSDDVSVLLGTGDGTFGPKNDYPSGSGPTSVAVGDFNQDGRPDVAVANVYDNTVSVLLNGPPIPLSLGLAGVPACAGQAVALTLTPGCPDTGGPYAAELSAASGSFASPTSLGSVQAGANALALPAATPTGAGYRIRVLSGGMARDTTAAFQVNALGTVGLSTPTTPGRVCLADSLAVTFATTGRCPFPLENAFTVQLSNAFGSFANPTGLGTATVGTTKLDLPEDLPAGTGYRIRIVSSNPVQTSAASVPFRVEGPSLAVTPSIGGAPVCRGSAVTVSFSLAAGSCPFPGGNAFTAELSSATGNFGNPISLGPVVPGQATSVSIPASVATGTGYRIRVVSSSPVVTSSGSSPFQVRSCASRLSAEAAHLVVAPNPVSGGEIRCRVTGLDNPTFGLTTTTGQSLPLTAKTDGRGEWVLTPKQTLTAGVYLLQASGGNARLTTRVLVAD